MVTPGGISGGRPFQPLGGITPNNPVRMAPQQERAAQLRAMNMDWTRAPVSTPITPQQHAQHNLPPDPQVSAQIRAFPGNLSRSPSAEALPLSTKAQRTINSFAAYCPNMSPGLKALLISSSSSITPHMTPEQIVGAIRNLERSSLMIMDQKDKNQVAFLATQLSSYLTPSATPVSAPPTTTPSRAAPGPSVTQTPPLNVESREKAHQYITNFATTNPHLTIQMKSDLLGIASAVARDPTMSKSQIMNKLQNLHSQSTNQNDKAQLRLLANSYAALPSSTAQVSANPPPTTPSRASPTPQPTTPSRASPTPPPITQTPPLNVKAHEYIKNFASTNPFLSMNLKSQMLRIGQAALDPAMTKPKILNMIQDLHQLSLGMEEIKSITLLHKSLNGIL